MTQDGSSHWSLLDLPYWPYLWMRTVSFSFFSLIFSFVTICGIVHHYFNNWIRHLFDRLLQTMAPRVLCHYCESANTSLPYVYIYIVRELHALFFLSLSLSPSLARHRLTLDCIRIPGVQRDQSFTRCNHSAHQSERWVADSARWCQSTYVWPGARRLHNIAP